MPGKGQQQRPALIFVQKPTEVLMSTTKQCLACIRTCHRIARESEGYVATSMR